MPQPSPYSTSITPLRFAAAQPASSVPAPAPRLQSAQPRPSFYQEFTAHQLLRQINALPENWDGYGGASVHSDTALNAHRALSALLLTVPVPEIIPNSNGTVSFEWQSPLGHANLEIGLTRFSFFVALSPGPTIPLDGAASSVPDVLGSVISALLFPQRGADLTAMTVGAK
jgi:hypothetical protein